MTKFGMTALILTSLFGSLAFAQPELDLEALRALTVQQLKTQNSEREKKIAAYQKLPAYDFSLVDRTLKAMGLADEPVVEFTTFITSIATELSGHTRGVTLQHIFEKASSKWIVGAFQSLSADGNNKRAQLVLGELVCNLIVSLKKSVEHFVRPGSPIPRAMYHAEINAQFYKLLICVNKLDSIIFSMQPIYVPSQSTRMGNLYRPRDVIAADISRVFGRFNGDFDKAWRDTVDELARAYVKYHAKVKSQSNACDSTLEN